MAYSWKAGEYSDGEENALPVLTNRMLVTGNHVATHAGNGTKNFSFDKLLQSGNSESLQHFGLTLNIPATRPGMLYRHSYLMEYPYECAEFTWNRYYANSLATFIANSSPKIKQIILKSGK